MNKRRFIAQQGSGNTVKVFTAETGQLYRIIDVGGNISTSPICMENELTVGIKQADGTHILKIYSVPGFSLKKVINA